MAKYIVKKNTRLELIFKASCHKFDSAKFHSIVDGIKGTITLIKNEFGKIIGGYLSKSLDEVKTGEYLNDPDAFLFSITERKKFNIINSETKYAAKNVSDHGPVFGYGWDLAISNKCDTN